MSVLGRQLSQPILVVQGSARGCALVPDRQGSSMSASLTNRNLALPAGAAHPYNSYPTEQNGSFVPPALTTSIEKMLLVMPASCCLVLAAVLQQAFMVPAHFCTGAVVSKWNSAAYAYQASALCLFW